MENYEIINVIFLILFGFFIGLVFACLIEAKRFFQKSARMHDLFRENYQQLIAAKLFQEKNNNNYECKSCENNRIQNKI
jgi:hypothetical protein